MRNPRLAFMFVVSTVVLLCLSSQASAQSAGGYATISTAELKKMQESGKEILLIDTLADSRYKQEHLPGAQHFEFPNGNMDPWDRSKTGGKSSDDFVALLGGDKERTLVFYCLDDQ